MKKIFILITMVLFTGIITGQKPVDYLMKGKALIEAGKPDNAIIIFNDAIGLFQESALYLERAEAYMLKGDYSNAVSDINSANTLTPSSGEFSLARIYGLKADAATSVYHLELCLKSPFKKSEKEILLDPSFSLIENTPEWRQFWKGDWYGNYEKAMAEIEYDISTGNIGEAKNQLKGLADDYSGNEGNIYAGAMISLAESKYPETIKAVTGLLSEKPGNVKYLLLLARAQEGAGNQTGASVTYTTLLDLGIADANLLLLRAECYRKTGEVGKAIEDIDKYLSYYPENMKALSYAGKIESAAGDNIQALKYFSENLKLHPDNAGCYIDRANSYFLSKSWDWAIKDYSMSLDLQPDNSEVWLNKGISLLNSGDIDDACHDFRISFSLGNKRATEYVSRNCIK